MPRHFRVRVSLGCVAKPETAHGQRPKEIFLVVRRAPLPLGRTELHQRQQMVFLRMGLARTGRLVPGQQLLQPLFWWQGHRLAQPGVEAVRGDGARLAELAQVMVRQAAANDEHALAARAGQRAATSTCVSGS